MNRIILFFLLMLSSSSHAQSNGEAEQKLLNKPKLVVGIIVDQMRYDFLFRYWDKYSTGGFKRMIEEGYLCRNVHYDYIPTYTGPGHASVYTGTTPSVHGIVSNDWFDRETGKTMYCVSDSSVKGVGGGSKMAPRNLFTTTIPDELRLASKMQSKVIGIALKDRGAILPAGHSANAAYWIDASGNWVSSSYYMQNLPLWVNDFNKRNLQAEYLSQPWKTVLPIEQYTESTADNNTFEEPFLTEVKPVFPHNLPVIHKADADLLKRTPFGNTMTKEFALATIKGEELGHHEVTDFICISFSSTDYVGHQFGIDAIETEDTYLRLDRDLSELVMFLDKWVGKDNLLVFLTADHGAAHNSEYLKAQKIPAGVIDGQKLNKLLTSLLDTLYGKGKYISVISSHDIYLNNKEIAEKKVNRKALIESIKTFLLSTAGIADVATAEELMGLQQNNSQREMLRAGMNSLRAADIYFTLKPQWMDYNLTGTTHGSGYDYDTHVPLLFWGGKISTGFSEEYHSITDIAPTVCTYLNISFPSGCTGKIITEIFQK
ncbi:MAG: alkaline phosphatase family protein [Bacteroidia bacterium]|nr:alkaline phosphatase family protein [Bacteroidia bacterium]